MARLRGVSIVVPVHNAEQWVGACVANLKDVLDRASDDSEVLFIENGSTDGTLTALQQGRDSRIRVLQSQSGIVPALNLGLEHAQHEWIMRHDADDLSRPDRILRFWAFLDSQPKMQFSVVCSHSMIANEKDQILARMPVGPGTGFVHGSVFLNRQRVLEAGGYTSRLPHAEDQDLWARLALRPYFQIGFIPECLYWFRSHGRSVSATQLQTQLAAFPHESGGVWTPRVRAAVARLAWDKNRWGAFKLAIKNAQLKKPQKQDWGVPTRIFGGDRFDRLRALRAWDDEPALVEFARYVRTTAAV